MLKIKDDDFLRLSIFTKKNYGIDLKDKKVLIEGRLSSTLKQNGYTNFKDYIDNLVILKDDITLSTFLNKITTNHTFFLREMEHYNFLSQTILPYYEKYEKNKDIRIWSAGCSTGQEAYTTAIIINEYFGHKKSEWDTTILASDISVDALKKGRKAIYLKDELTGLPEQWIKKYFINKGNNLFEVCDKIKKEVVFKKINLMDNFQFKKPFDLILCRNVMIYYDNATRDNLMNKFYHYTKMNGYFFIGHSEILSKNTSLYKCIKPAIYLKDKV
ncbi:MAG: CheR family methyltransferase [Oscillospiraceae bacterium]